MTIELIFSYSYPQLKPTAQAVNNDYYALAFHLDRELRTDELCRRELDDITKFELGHFEPPKIVYDEIFPIRFFENNVVKYVFLRNLEDWENWHDDDIVWDVPAIPLKTMRKIIMEWQKFIAYKPVTKRPKKIEKYTKKLSF